MDSNEEKRLSDCLNSIIQKVNTVLTQLKAKHELDSQTHSSTPRTTTQSNPTTTYTAASDDPLFENSVQNNNVNTFTIDTEEENLLNQLTAEIQAILKTRLPQLSTLCSNYIEKFLHEYHFDKDQRVFTEALTANILYNFHQNLKGLLIAAKAYPAALRGDLATVKNFLQYHSNYKDKSGFWGTTLLYSAAKGNHFDLIKHLIESAGCSVNAQNQTDITYALITDNDTARTNANSLGYDPDPKAASTALHAACFGNNIQIVKYLIEKGANYFLRNQLGETPIENGQNWPAIRDFFKDYLISSYLNTPNAMIPKETILDCHDRKPNNCVWEYKPVKGFEWNEFTMTEHNTLSTSLTPVKDDQSFNPTIYLSGQQSTYTVNLLTFFRGSKNQDPNPSIKDSATWIRCRGSSIANFDIHCLWQLMFVKHETCNQSTTNTPLPPPSLDAMTIPSVYDSKFQVRLNSWHTCDSKLNDLLDETINNRRRYVDIDHPYIGNFRCNLFSFTFTNTNKTILGFIRWIPKFIANTPRTQNFIKELDNFQANNQSNPIPLTTKRLEQFIRSKRTTDENTAEATGVDDDELESANNLSIVETEIDDTDDTTQSTDSAANTGNWCLTDIINTTFEHQNERDNTEENSLTDSISTDTSSLVHGIHSTTTESVIGPELPQDANDYINDQSRKPVNRNEHLKVNPVPVAQNLAEQDEAALKARGALETENGQLKKQLAQLEEQMKEQYKQVTENNMSNQEIFIATMDKLEETQQQLNEKVQHEELINETAKKISTAKYTIPKSNQSIFFKWNLLFKCLRTFDYPQKRFFQDIVPRIDFHEHDDSTLVLKGFPIHHTELKNIFDRLQELFDRVQSAEEFYERKTQKNVRLLIKVIERVRPNNQTYWKHYRDYLVKLIHEKCNEYTKKFKEYMNNQLKDLMNNCIESSSTKFRKDIGSLTNEYMQRETFSEDIDTLKIMALDEFIRDHVLYQQKSTKSIPTKASVTILNQHIDKLKNLLSTKSSYKGCELQHFQMIVQILQRIMIYYNCFLLQLPLFNVSMDLLNKIENSTVTTIETATGSGKSTLLPALLVAEGYDKIIVTQPRRLPCNLICQRVNSMVSDDISGWAVSGAEHNIQAKILYMTDGFLKERLLNDQNLITINTKVNKSVVFFIDEVHERSVNIDLCLALFARLLKLNPDLKTKMKLIISSATLDASVPALFKKNSDYSLNEFNLTSISKLYPVTVNQQPDENILDLVQQLYSKRVRKEQILCFVGSTQEAYDNCALLKTLTKGAIIAYPLVQSQSAIEQQKYIEHGTIFFSTTVAETSLTFPCLKYVIDTGIINMPVYNLELERSELKETKTAESTTKQRLGRLGRTQPGEYYALYNYGPGEQRKYPVPQICQSDLVYIEFVLRKSRLRTSLVDFQQYFPDKPDQPYIDDAIKQLQKLGIVSSTSSRNLTNLGQSISKLPDFGSLPMAKSVYSALRKYRCGRDLIILSSILSILNTSSILKSIPSQYKCAEGDFMTLLKVMNTILLVRDSVSSGEFNVDRVCNAKGLSACAHIIKQALRRYTNLERAFTLSDEFREDAQIQSSDWEYIAKALLDGFSDKVFVSLKMLQGKAQQFLKYNVEQRKSNQQQEQPDNMSTIAVIDRSSILRTGNKGLLPASLVISRDVRYLTAVRSAAIISFVGKIELEWLEYTFTREMKLNESEEKKLIEDSILQQAIQKFPHIQINIRDHKLIFRGPSCYVLNAELFIRQQLVTVLTFRLEPPSQPNKSSDNLTRNLQSITMMPIDLFGPLRWRWEAEQQVKIRTKMNGKQGTVDVTVEGLDSQNRAVKEEFDSFLSWLRSCAVIRDPHSGVAPRALNPQIRQEFRDMEAKINNITDPDRTSVDRWKSLKGPKATRETRMEVVAWIAVCTFECRLEGGFVRDWVVGNYSSKPVNLSPQQWVQFDPKSGIPILNKDFVPSDLDCHLPAKKQFDVEAFLDALHGYGISAKVFRQNWRYVLLIDENTKTGPFTMDLIEPHIALTHDRIDFDVSNLYLEKLYTRDLGMRVDITRDSLSIQLETIVQNIRKKEFQVLRPIDGENGPNTSGTVAERIQKMKSRGWTQIGKPLNFIPNPPPKYNAILIPYPSSTVLYQNIVTAMQTISGARVLSIEQIKNPDVESLYENMKRSIAKECPGKDPNERELYHGTSGDAIEGIINKGYDDRYFSTTGAWGRGAYFADDPRKSNGYAIPDQQTNRRVIFYNKVLLGIESVQTQTNNALSAAPLNHHSVHGAGGWAQFQYHEYIVYRYGQALPYLKITYTAPYPN